MSELIISRLRGEDGHKVISLRISNGLLKELEDIAAKSNRSRNEIVTTFIKYGLQNYTISE